MGWIKNVREFFWPLLEEESSSGINELVTNDVIVNQNNLQKTLDYIFNCYNAESDRRKTIESKASSFIGTISVVTSVVLGVTSMLVKEESNSDMNVLLAILILLLFVLTIYMSRTIWFSVRVLERSNYHSISATDFMQSGQDDDYYKKIIVEVSNKIARNAQTINDKVDNMTMAQEYFKRAIVVVALYSFVILLLFLSKTDLSLYTQFQKGINLLNTIDVSGWHLIILYILSISSIVLSILAIKRRN
ncbi:hypothetical protein [Bacteroides stercoris]|jgi:protein-S-isoprenylcysteine O-methyltransferase Ste14|uniref:hypothetical protein n=1 Tax=Bacteroides stercoris TaxID=46506 RepID=UPI00319E61AE